MDVTVDTEGAWVPEAALQAALGTGLRRFLAALHTVEVPDPARRAARYSRTVLKAYRRDGARLYLSRARAALLLRTPALKPLARAWRFATGAPPVPPPIPEDRLGGSVAPPMYDYQEPAVEHLLHQLNQPMETNGGIQYMQMNTGDGKTRVGAELTAALGVKTLVVVPSHGIASQWVDEFSKVLPAARVGTYSNAHPVGPDTCDVVLIVINTLVGNTRTPGKDAAFMAQYGLLLMDEAHELVSDTHKRALWLAQAVPRVVAFTATPRDRKDGLDLHVDQMLGGYTALASITDTRPPQYRGAVTELRYAAPAGYRTAIVGAAGTVSAPETITNICADPQRLTLVAQEALRLALLHATATAAELGALGLDGGRQHGVLVFAEHRAYLDRLRAEIERLGGAQVVVQVEDDAVPDAPLPNAPLPSPAISVLRGGVAPGALAAARDLRAHIVLTTYGYCRRGISLDMTAMVTASPRRNGGTQITGRILRRSSDPHIVRQIVDIVDPALASQMTTRRQVYKQRGFPVTIRHASPPDGPPLPDEPQPDASRAVDDFLAGLGIEDLIAIANGK